MQYREKQIDDTGRNLSASIIENYEKLLKLKLPSDYKHFLLLVNGGTPQDSYFRTGSGNFDISQVQVFFGIERDLDCENIEWKLNVYSSDIPNGTLPIATGPGDQVLLLGTANNNFGSVWFIDFTDGLEGNEAIYLTASFFEFFDAMFDFDPIKEFGLDC